MHTQTFLLHWFTINLHQPIVFSGMEIRTNLLPVLPVRPPSPNTGNPRTGGPRPPFVHINPKFPTRNLTLLNFPVNLSLLEILPLLWQQNEVVSEPWDHQRIRWQARISQVHKAHQSLKATSSTLIAKGHLIGTSVSRQLVMAAVHEVSVCSSSA